MLEPVSQLGNSNKQPVQLKPTSASNVKTAEFHRPADSKDVLKRKEVILRHKTTSQSLISEFKSRHEEILDKSLQIPHCSKFTSSDQTKHASSTQIKRETAANQTVGNDRSTIRWHGQGISPRKLDPSTKLMVKSSLIRPELKENGLISSKSSQSPLKVSYPYIRIVIQF